jgi:hypothetical protein
MKIFFRKVTFLKLTVEFHANNLKTVILLCTLLGFCGLTALRETLSNLLEVELTLNGAHHGIVVRKRKRVSYQHFLCIQ